MQTDLPGLFAAGEAVGGANGANRLSGNAITEALVFGRRAGRSAAAHVKRTPILPDRADNAGAIADLITADVPGHCLNTAEMVQTFQATMQDDVGALRTQAKLKRALDQIGQMAKELGDLPPGDGNRFDMRRIDWFDLRNMLLVGRVVAETALAPLKPAAHSSARTIPVCRRNGRSISLSDCEMGASCCRGRPRIPARQPHHDRMCHAPDLARHRCKCRRLGDLRGAVRAGPIGARRFALDPDSS